MNLDRVTTQDCIEAHYMRDMAVVLNDGKVVGFIKEDKQCEK